MTHLTLYDIAQHYANCEINGKAVSIPYMINDGSRFCSPKTKGKGSWKEIKNEFLEKAYQEKINLEKVSAEEMRGLMQTWGIGIDCSGIVCQVLEEYLFENFGTHLFSEVSVHGGFFGKVEKLFPSFNKISRINATTLLSPLNTTQIDVAKNIREGDFISLTHPNWPTKHIVLVIKVGDGAIHYVNSSDKYTDSNGNQLGYCEKNGAHIESIKILDPEADLDKQLWSEKTILGENYGKKCFRIDKGDSVRRFNSLCNYLKSVS